MERKHIDTIIKLLKQEFPEVTTALQFGNPLEILVATILSAQCTDVRVNIVTKNLFKKYKKPEEYAQADLKTFEGEIRSTGFYHNKAKNIISTCQKIVKVYNSKVPDSMEELITLSGVARKTANIVLYHGYGRNEGIAVDTHVKRLSQRLGLTTFDDPEKIEQDLMKLTKKDEWGRLSDLLIEHGRKTCMARNPQCLLCVLGEICPSKKLFIKK